MVNSYVQVRSGDGVGKMIGFGHHLHNEQHTKFALHANNECMKGSVPNIISDVGNLFSQHFTSQDVGFEDMISIQSELWLKGTPAYPQCWVASDGLGNSMHIDKDGSCSFALWLCSSYNDPTLSGGVNCDLSTHRWWFLLPMHHVAIALTSGTFISWDGRVVEHCTAVPPVFDDGNRLLYLFTGLPQNLVNVLRQEKICKQMLVQK